jgi:hypothetical protein
MTAYGAKRTLRSLLPRTTRTPNKLASFCAKNAASNSVFLSKYTIALQKNDSNQSFITVHSVPNLGGGHNFGMP